ncbi:hypothetical protein [Adlercreutzia aquisgranensis]|uniref:hypothetical protein n=1 Tax=Adlercreutzia aquisgranensis TaxID=2941323 RepID=UPI002040419F|nr:hypothetical protein [Adlercreutzia aquisgranensis]
MIGRGGRRAIVLCCAVMLVLAAGLSFARVQQVNKEVRDLVVQRQTEGREETSRSEGSIAETERRTFQLGESVDLSGIKPDKKVLPQGVSIEISNPRFYGERELMELHDGWVPLGSVDRESNRAQYLMVDLLLKNESSEEVSLPPIYLKSGVWKSIYSPSNIFYFNDLEAGATISVLPGESKSYVLVYDIPSNVLDNVASRQARDLPFELVMLDYPTEIVIEVN